MLKEICATIETRGLNGLRSDAFVDPADLADAAVKVASKEGDVGDERGGVGGARGAV
jgi:hypothetical protein